MGTKSKTAGKKTNRTAKPVAFVDVSKAKREDAELSALTFDRRLQHRAQLFDTSEGGAVAQYAEADAPDAKAGKPTRFPPLKVVREKVEDGTIVLWVYDGFQRGEAFRENKRKTVPIEVIDGTFRDAFILSLSSNSENSVLPRDRQDKRRSVKALVENEDSLALAFSVGKKTGGATAAMAQMCGVSVGTVQNALIDLGLQVKGDKLVKRPEPKEKAPPPADSTPTEPADELDEETKKKLADAAFAEMCRANALDRVRHLEKVNRQLGAAMAALVTDTALGADVKKVLRTHKIGLDADFDVRAQQQGPEFSPYYEILELWAPVQKIGALIADLKRLAEREPTETEAGQDTASAPEAGK